MDSMRLTPGPYLTIILMAKYRSTAGRHKSPSIPAPPAERERESLAGPHGGAAWTDLQPSYSAQPTSFPWWLSAPASVLQWLPIPVADSVCSAWSGVRPVLWPGQSRHSSPGGPLGLAPRPRLAPVACSPCLLALPPAALTRGRMAITPLTIAGG